MTAARPHLSTEDRQCLGSVLKAVRPELDQPVAGRNVGATREDVHDLVSDGIKGIECFASDQETSTPVSLVRGTARRWVRGRPRCRVWVLESRSGGRPPWT